MVSNRICRHALLALLAVAFVGPAARAQFTESQKLTPAGLSADDLFGQSIGFDGHVAVVGARQNKAGATGYATVYRGCGGMQEEATLSGTGVVVGAQFGRDVAVDGDVIVVGAPYDKPPEVGGVDSGSAYVYRYDGTTWQEEQKLTPSDVPSGALFGFTVVVEGSWIAVGAIDHGGSGFHNGAVYMFEHDGNSWVEKEILFKSPDQFSRFGISLDLDGNSLAVGAMYDRYGSAVQGNTGSAHVYVHDGSAWVLQRSFKAQDTVPGDFFGTRVSLYGDRLLVGAIGDATDDAKPEAGAAYVFERTAGNWTETQRLVASDRDGAARFGLGVALEGPLALVAAYKDGEIAVDAGAVYVFQHDGATWTEIQKITSSDLAADDGFGFGLALRNSCALVGAFGDDDAGSDSGSVYQFLTAPFLQWGDGLAGAGGFVPTISATGDTAPGANLSIHIDDFVGGADVFCLAGAASWSLPIFGGNLFVNVTAPFVIWPMTAGGAPGAPGDGDSSTNSTIPAGLGCMTLTLQCLGVDNAAPHGFSMSNALEIWFRN